MEAFLRFVWDPLIALLPPVELLLAGFCPVLELRGGLGLGLGLGLGGQTCPFVSPPSLLKIVFRTFA